MRNLLALLTAVGNRVADWVGLESDFPGRSWWPFIPIVSIVIGLAAVAWIMALGNRRKTPTEKLAHAELLSRRGKHQEAKDEFREVHAYGRAAQMAVKLNRFEEAVELALKGNDFQTAAGILSGQGRFAEAAQAFEQARKPMEAADHWEKAGDFDRALRQYASAGNGRKVQEILSRLERWGELSRILSEELISARAHLGPNPTVKAQERISHQAERTAEVFKRAGDFTGAYEVFLRSGQVLKAAECLEKLGQPERAADLYRQGGRLSEAARVLIDSGQYERAIDLYDEMDKPDEIPRILRLAGKIKESKSVEARIRLSKGDRIAAAGLLEEAEEWREAAQLYDEEGDISRSAPLWEKAGEWDKAAGAYERGGEIRKAIPLYIRGSRHLNAGSCLEKLGESEAAEGEYAAGDVFFHAGRMAEARERIDAAITHYQRVPVESADAWNANHALARLFWKKGLQSLAQEKFDVIIAGSEMGRDNMGAFYDYAVFLEGIGRLQDALAWLEKILVVDFHFKDVLQRKKGVEERLRNLRGAAGAVPQASGRRAPDEIGAGTVFLERYEILEEVGGGGMGVVYSALDRKLHRKVALKVLVPRALDSKEEEERFLQEARVAAKLSHPHIVAFYDVGKHRERLFLVMELVEGKNLLQLVKASGPLPIGTAVEYLSQIADALAYAHERKIVHRDIKSANVLVSSKQGLKVTDFGLARFLRNAQITATRAVGSPLYMAPELIVGKKYDHRVDLYSLGVVAYELLAGRPPFTEGEVMYHHMHADPEPLSKVRKEIPTALEALVLKLLEKEPSARFASASEVKAELEPLASTGPSVRI